MILGVIEISERVTRLRVSEVGFDRARRLTDRSSLVSAELRNCDRLSALLMAEIETARDAGAERVEVIASRKLRGTRLLRLLDRVTRAVGAGAIQIPGATDALAANFMAVTRPLETLSGSVVAVARIGESSTGVAVGPAGGVPEWIGSRALGAANLTDKAGFADPPGPNQIEAAINGATHALTSLALPDFERAFIGTPLSAVLQRLCGPRIDPVAARRALGLILGQTADDIAAWFGAESAQARLVPATLAVTLALSELTGVAVEPCAADPVAGRTWLARSRAAVSSGQWVV